MSNGVAWLKVGGGIRLAPFILAWQRSQKRSKDESATQIDHRKCLRHFSQLIGLPEFSIFAVTKSLIFLSICVVPQGSIWRCSEWGAA